jgi:PhzF family phenazine biosynthesis protein
MHLTLFQVDAFTDEVFRGNPAAVMPLTDWLPDDLLQAFAAENNLSETAFFVPSLDDGADFELRWFTPVTEVDLCGHATLASAHVLLNEMEEPLETIRFRSQSGILTVRRLPDGRLAMDFPARPPVLVEDRKLLGEVSFALGKTPECLLKARDLVAVFQDASEVRALEPDFAAIAALDCFALMATAPGDEDGLDFVSRFFAPAKGVPEDPVTGSAHSTLAPYWGRRLDQSNMVAEQASLRGGLLWLTHEPGSERVEIAGHTVTYLRGTVEI